MNILTRYKKLLGHKEEKNMATNINTKWNALAVHRQTIERMEMLENRNAELHKSLREKSDCVVRQDKTIQAERDTRDVLIEKCEELENEIKAQEILTTHTFDEAEELIKKQNAKISMLETMNASLLDGCSDGEGIPTYRTMKKQYVKAITKIELIRVRLMNCAFYAEQALALGNLSFPVRKYFNDIIVESSISDNGCYAINAKTGEVVSTLSFKEIN